MALSIANITIELREILLKDRPKSLYDISPKGTVPVLQTQEKIIDESLDIIYWAMDNFENSEQYLTNLNLQEDLIHQNDTEFKMWLDRYKYNERYDDFSLNECKSNCKKIIDQFENNLNEFSYLSGNTLSMVDVSIFPFIRQYSNVDINYFSNTFPNTTNWLNRQLNSNLFKSVMKKYPQWKIGDEPKIINFNSELIEA